MEPTPTLEQIRGLRPFPVDYDLTQSYQVTPIHSSSSTENADTQSIKSNFSLEGRDYIVRKVHDYCLEAVKEQLQDIGRNVGLRQGISRYDPETGAGAGQPLFDGRLRYRSTTCSTDILVDNSDSLAANTTTVCNILWARGNAMSLFSHVEEMVAVDKMGVLLRATQIILDALLVTEDLAREKRVVGDVFSEGIRFCACLGDDCRQELIELLADEYYDGLA